MARRLAGKAAAQHRSRAEGEPQVLLDTDTTRWTTLTPRASIEDAVAAREVVARLAELPDRQKIAVYLRHVHGWSAADIGDYLKCAPATANVHLHRGKQRLRIALAIVGCMLMEILWNWSPMGPVPDDHSLIPGDPFLSAILVVFAVALAVAAVFGLLVAIVVAVERRRTARRDSDRASTEGD